MTSAVHPIGLKKCVLIALRMAGIKNLVRDSVNPIPHAAYQRISKYIVRVDWLNGVFANCTSVAQRHDHVAQMSCSDLRNRAKPLATSLGE